MENIIDFAGKESDLSKAIFHGGLQQEDLHFITDEELRNRLTPHIGQPESNQLPEDSGAITGSFTKEEAEEWLAEYKNEMSKVP